MSRIHVLLIGLLAAILGVSAAANATTLSGTYADYTFTSANSPYYIAGTVTLTGIVTCDTDVTINFYHNASMYIEGNSTEATFYGSDLEPTIIQPVNPTYHPVGIFVRDHAALELVGVTVQNMNTYDYGFIKLSQGSDFKVRGSQFNNCSSTGKGGVIYADGTLYGSGNLNMELYEAKFNGNHAVDGGAIYIDGDNQQYIEYIFDACEFDGNYASGDGGAIMIFESPSTDPNPYLDIRWSYFYDNYAVSGDGGAIAIVDAYCEIWGDEFGRNESQAGNGGAVSISGSDADVFVYSGTTFTGNTADDYGGALVVAAGAQIHLLDCSVSNCSAYHGGALCVTGDGTDLDVHGCVFSGNAADNFGGALYLDLGAEATFSDNTVSGGTASRGGALYVTGNGTSLDVDDCVFSGNTGESKGGCFMAAGTANLSMDYCTIYENSGIYGGAGYIEGISATTVSLNHCTIADNNAEDSYGGFWSGSSAVTTVTNSIMWNNTEDGSSGPQLYRATATYSDIQGSWPGTGNINSDPLFVNAANDDYSLAAASPCVDAGYGSNDPDGTTADMGGIPTTWQTGTISGTRNWSGTVYVRSVEIAYGGYVEVAPGTDIYFRFDGELTAIGSIALEGTSQAPITAQAVDGETWDLTLGDSHLQLSERYDFQHVLLRDVGDFTAYGGTDSDASYGLLSLYMDNVTYEDSGPIAVNGELYLVSFTDCIFRESTSWSASVSINTRYHANTSQEVVIFSGCTFEDNYAGIDLTDIWNITIEDCSFFGRGSNSDYAIHIEASDYRGTTTRQADPYPEITNVVIRNYGESAVSLNSEVQTTELWFKPLISNSEITGNCVAYQPAGLLTTDYPSIELDHCTIADNYSPIKILAGYSDVDVINSILSNSGDEFSCTNSYLVDVNVSYSDAEITLADYASHAWLTNGGNNIIPFADPLFVDDSTDDYHLQANSPCIGEGSGGTDIGAYQYSAKLARGPETEAPALPTAFAVAQNAPNPFNPSTTIRFDLPSESMVRLSVYNLNGQLVRTLVNDVVPAGFHAVTWNGTDMVGRSVASGVYVYRLVSDLGVTTNRMTLMR